MSEPDLVAHLALFGRALRERGVRVSLSDEADALAALTLIQLGDREEVRLALRAALKIQPPDVAIFEAQFVRFWAQQEENAAAPRTPQQPWIDPALLKSAPGARPRAGAATEVEVEVPTGEEPGFSADVLLRRKPFEECSEAELAELERLMVRLARSLATRPSRRLVPTRGRGVADLRRSFRQSIAHGGELLTLARRARAIERPHLVVLCDTSASMDPHSRFLLAFVLALSRVARRSEVFAFNTTLVRLTSSLARAGTAGGRVDLALSRLSSSVSDWSGGTRIGECLGQFREYYLDTLVHGKTVVLILSDGLDCGDLSPLAGAMRDIHARARRVLWLNPLAGDARYEPTARAMAAALPYVDRLLPAHNLESLARLLPLLAA